MRSVSAVLIASAASLLGGCADQPADIGSPSAGRTLTGQPVAAGAATVARWDTLPGERWRLEEDLRIGVVQGSGQRDPRVFGDVRGLMPTDDGSVWVFDLLASELRLFDAGGAHVISIGRRGQGPGEFTTSSCGRDGVGDEVWVETESNWHRFDSRGNLLGTFPSPASLTCGVRAWLDSTTYLVSNTKTDFETRTWRTYFTTHEWTGEGFVVRDTIKAPETGEARTITVVDDLGEPFGEWEIPFDHTPGWRLQRDGSFVVWSGGGDYLLHVVSLAGDTLRSLSRAYVPVRVDSEERQEALDRILRPGSRIDGDFGVSDIPVVHPPFVSARANPDGTVWVRRVADGGRTALDVFSIAGRYLGELEVPAAFSDLVIHGVYGEYVWGIDRDEYGVESVIRARLVKSDSQGGLPN